MFSEISKLRARKKYHLLEPRSVIFTEYKLLKKKKGQNLDCISLTRQDYKVRPGSG